MRNILRGVGGYADYGPKSISGLCENQKKNLLGVADPLNYNSSFVKRPTGGYFGLGSIDLPKNNFQQLYLCCALPLVFS